MQPPTQLSQFNEAIMPGIEAVCSPLLKTFGITHFGHIKFNNDGLMLRLANHKRWNGIFYQEGFYNDIKTYDFSWVPIGERRKRFLIGAPLTPHEKVLFENNLWNFLLIYERTENEGSFTFFGTDRDNRAAGDYYLNYPDAFDHFLIYFKEKAFPFLEMKKDRCIQLDIAPLKGCGLKDNLVDDFYKTTEVSKFHLGALFNNLTLSKREAESLYHFLRGQSTKEIAKTVGVSPKTIESYVNNIKIKTGVTNKTKLIDKLFSALPYLS